MSVSGLCQICQANEATDRCDQCGNLVCLAHYDDEVGFCAECATTVKRQETEDRSYRF